MTTNKIKVIVIDDEEAITTVMRLLLENQGYNVITRNNGKDGLAAIQAEDPDLIICDVRMPRMNGYDVHRELMKMIQFRLTPFLLHSGSIDTYERTEAIKYMGIKGVLDKPCRAETLYDKVREALGPRGMVMAE